MKTKQQIVAERCAELANRTLEQNGCQPIYTAGDFLTSGGSLAATLPGFATLIHYVERVSDTIAACISAGADVPDAIRNFMLPQPDPLDAAIAELDVAINPNCLERTLAKHGLKIVKASR